MSFVSVRPGRVTLGALEWLARVGCSPMEPLALVSGCGERATRDHVRRLENEGLVRRVAMTRGAGSLIVVTESGARMAGEGRLGAPRSVAPSTWAHAVASAWVAASFQVRDRPWVSPREVALDPGWQATVTYRDASGDTRRVLHRPDLGTEVKGAPVAVEVELQRKSKERLRGILDMYRERTSGPDKGLASVVYIAGNQDVTRTLQGVAETAGLPERAFRVVALGEVIEQTRRHCAAAVA